MVGFATKEVRIFKRTKSLALIDRAVERGGKDNVTVVVAQYGVKEPQRQRMPEYRRRL